MRAPDSRLEHATTPDRNLVVARYLFDPLCLCMTANSAQFDVDYPARLERDCVRGIFCGTNRLIQTNGRLNLSLEYCMIEDVVVSKWLLQHHQVEAVELLEQRHVGEFVS